MAEDSLGKDQQPQTIRKAYDHARDRDRVASVEIDFTDQKAVMDLLVEQFFDLDISKDHEMGVFLFGKRQITQDGQLTTTIEATFPSKIINDRYFDLTSEEVTEEMATLLEGQSKFQREWLGIVHTHPRDDNQLYRENFSPRGQSINPDEDFYHNVCQNSPGILFGLAYQNGQEIKYKFLHKGVTFNSPQRV